jgi:hypothetical protein
MELVHPNETLGLNILMSLPQVIVHRLDGRSPLVPPQPVWYDSEGREHEVVTTNSELCIYENVEKFLSDRDAEIIVLLEGTDELTGSALQARHSYRVEDIAWDHSFAPCVFPGGSQNSTDDESRWSWFRQRRCDTHSGTLACTVDFEKFHDIVEAPTDCDACSFVPQ